MSQPNFLELIKSILTVRKPLEGMDGLMPASKSYGKPANQIDHQLAKRLAPNQRAGGWGEYDTWDKGKTQWQEEMIGEW